MFEHRKEKDWPSAWLALAKEAGTDTFIPFGRHEKSTGHTEWFEVDHEDFDGTGALSELLRKEGWHLGVTPPKPHPAPAFWKKLWAAVLYGLTGGVKKTRWKTWDSTAWNVDTGFLWHIFSRDETRRIAESARNKNVSQNSFLLWGLNQSVSEHFLSTRNRKNAWLVPFNMRGLLPNSQLFRNLSSHVGVDLDFQADPLQVHGKIKSALAKNLHWGAWLWINIGVLIGLRGMRWLYRLTEWSGNIWTGFFSNLGSWPPPGSKGEVSEDIAWIVGPIVTRSHPICGVALIWRGQLVLSFKVHGFVCRDKETIHSCFQHWISLVNSLDG